MNEYLDGFDTRSKFKEYWLKHIGSIRREGRALDVLVKFEENEKSKLITSYKLGSKPRQREGPKHGVEDTGRGQTWHERLRAKGYHQKCLPQ